MIPRTLFDVLTRSRSHSSAMIIPIFVEVMLNVEIIMITQTMDPLGTAGRARVAAVMSIPIYMTWPAVGLMPSKWIRNNEHETINVELPHLQVAAPNIVQNRDITGLTP